MMDLISVVIIGYGYWGTNIARNIYSNPKYKIVGIVDQDLKRRKDAYKKYKVPVYDSYKSIPSNIDIDLAVIMTRPGSHFLISKYFLERNSNILVAKPCGVSKNQAEELLKISIKFKKKIFCDFTYHFSSVIKLMQLDSKLKKTIQGLQEYVSYRTSLGIVQSDLDVIADLACHDFYILGLLTKSQPLSVQCLNVGGTFNSLVKSVVINLRYKSGLSAVIHVGWNSPNKIRYFSFISDSSGIVIDENIISSPIKHIRYKKLSDNYLDLTYATRNQRNTRYSMGPSYSPIVSQKESLAAEFDEIAQNLHGKNNKLPTVIDAINIWKIIDSCRKSLKSNEGKFVKI